jgi:tryptophanyl-tRNA synthetase
VFVQSEVKAHAELHLLLSMMVPLPWLERVPTYKEQQEQLRDKDLNTYGFLGYPLLQAADILAYRAQAVPVGEDQVPHLELCREIARRFNHLFGDGLPGAPGAADAGAAPSGNRRPQDVEIRTGTPSSSATTAKTVGAKVDAMLTDPQRTHRHIPGNPEVCPVFATHKVFSEPETVAWADQGCRTAAIGCRDCKGRLKERLVAVLQPIAERRAAFSADPARVDRILDDWCGPRERSRGRDPSRRAFARGAGR